MLTNLSGLTHWIGDRAFHLMCDANSPINEVKDALFEFLKYVGQVEDQYKAQQAQLSAQAPVAPVEPDAPVQPEPEKVV